MNESKILSLVEDDEPNLLQEYFETLETNVDDAEYCKALLLAAESNRVECLSVLLSQSNLDICSTGRKAALEVSTKKGYRDIVRLLTGACRCQLHHRTSCCNSVLTLAVRMGHSDIVADLIKAGAVPKKASQLEDRSCLYIAVSQGNMKMVSLLLDAGCKPDRLEPSELVEAARKNYPDIIHVLLASGTAKHSQHLAMYLACKCNCVEAVSVLIDYGINVNTIVYGMSSLHIAAAHGHVRLVELLVAHNADVNQLDIHGRHALYHCCINSGNKQNILKSAQCLISVGANPNLGDPTPLFAACMKQDIQLVKLLLSSGACASVASQHNGGITPMSLSIIKGSKDITKLLIRLCCIQDFNIAMLVHNPPKLLVHPVPYMGISTKTFQVLKLLVASGGHLINSKFLCRLKFEQVQHPEFTAWIENQMRTPLSLQKICRRNIRKQLGHENALKTGELGLPGILQHFLEFSDFDDIDFEAW